MNAPGHLSPVNFAAPGLDLSPVWIWTSRLHTVWPRRGPLQGSTGPSAVAGVASPRGQLAAWLCCSWDLSRAHVPTLTAVPGTQDPCPAALQALFSLLIPSDIWPGCQQRPALLCVCPWLGTADVGTRRQDNCSQSLLGAPEVLPGPAAWWLTQQLGLESIPGFGWETPYLSSCLICLGPGSFEMLVAPPKSHSGFPLPR